MKRGIWPVAGCDEAGRGPLAGPVVAAAVILDPKRIPRGLNDSKKLDREEREKLYEKICATAEVAVAFGSTARIDRDNILRASLWALARAVRALPVRPKLVFVDGRDRIDVRLRLRGGDLRRRAGALDRRGLDRRQGDARPADGAARRRASGLRLRAPHGLQRAGAFRRRWTGSARPSTTAARSRRSRRSMASRSSRTADAEDVETRLPL